MILLTTHSNLLQLSAVEMAGNRLAHAPQEILAALLPSPWRENLLSAQSRGFINFKLIQFSYCIVSLLCYNIIKQGDKHENSKDTSSYRYKRV